MAGTEDIIMIGSGCSSARVHSVVMQCFVMRMCLFQIKSKSSESARHFLLTHE